MDASLLDTNSLCTHGLPGGVFKKLSCFLKKATSSQAPFCHKIDRRPLMNLGKLKALTLQNLRTLILLEEHDSIIAGAERLGKNHSGISRQIANIERMLQIKLIDTSSRRNPSFTEEGRRYLVNVKKGLQLLLDSQEEVMGLSASLAGDLRVIITKFGTPLLTTWMSSKINIQTLTCPLILMITSESSEEGIFMVLTLVLLPLSIKYHPLLTWWFNR